MTRLALVTILFLGGCASTSFDRDPSWAGYTRAVKQIGKTP